MRIYSWGSTGHILSSAKVTQTDVSSAKSEYEEIISELDSDFSAVLEKKLPTVKPSHSTLTLRVDTTGVYVGRETIDGWSPVCDVEEEWQTTFFDNALSYIDLQQANYTDTEEFLTEELHPDDVHVWKNWDGYPTV